MKIPNTLPLNAALRYADLGYQVFPCLPGKKAPLTEHGCKDATDDHTQIRAWWGKYPDANISISTARLLVVDVDGSENPWLNDPDRAMDLARAPMSLTPGGGRHYIFRQPSGKTYRNTAGLIAQKVDTRADGGYIVVPPSVVAGKAYRWAETMELDVGPEELPEPPDWLLALLDARPSKTAATPAVDETIKEGVRNSKLTSLAGAMRRRGTGEAAILAALREENRQRCVPPLEDEEVERIAGSIAKYEPEPLNDEPSILAAVEGLTPESPPEDVEPIIKAATKNLRTIARQRLFEAIKEATGLPLGSLRQEAASAFKDAEAEEPDHLDFARKVIAHVGSENILCVAGDVWLWEDTGVWRQAQDREIKGQLHQVLEPMADVTKNLVDGVFDLLRTEVFSPRHEWNSNDCLINLVNGTLRLSPTGVTLEPHAREHYLNTQISIEYTPDAPTPEHWQGFLESIWPDDPESIGTLQEIIGLFLTSDTRQQKIFLMVGPKRSGKGTIARLLVKLLGRHNVCGPTLSSLQQNFGLQPLINKTLAVISDARLGSRAEQHVITERLLAISGEDTLSIPRKYLEDWTGRLATRFLILTNEIPRLADSSGALASRFVVLKMSQSFLGREDHGLDQRLAGELPAILNWAIEGLYRLRERGYFLQPASAQEAIEELSDLGSPISAFIREACVIAPGAIVGCRDLYEAWRQWCGEQGRDHPGTLQTFGRPCRKSRRKTAGLIPAAVPGSIRAWGWRLERSGTRSPPLHAKAKNTISR